MTVLCALHLSDEGNVIVNKKEVIAFDADKKYMI